MPSPLVERAVRAACVAIAVALAMASPVFAQEEPVTVRPLDIEADPEISALRQARAWSRHLTSEEEEKLTEEAVRDTRNRRVEREKANLLRTYYLEAVRSFRAKRYDRAVMAAEMALEIDPENIAVQRLLFTAKMTRQDHELALQAEKDAFLDERALAEVSRESRFPDEQTRLARPQMPRREHRMPAEGLTRMQGLLNQRVSMNFINADLDYVIQTLFKISGVDVMAEQSVVEGKKLTLHVENVPLREVLDFIQRNYQGIRYTVTENAVWLVSPERPPLVPRAYPLSRGVISSGGFSTGVRSGGGASAGGGGGGTAGKGDSHLEAMLEWVEGWEDEWPAGSTWFLDRQTTTLMVLTTPEMHERIDEILDVMDTVPIQVLVRTKFIEVQSGAEKEFGLGLTFLDPTPVTIDGESRPIADWMKMQQAIEGRFPSVQGGQLSLEKTFSMGSFDVMGNIRLLMEDSRAKMLSAPQVLAMNNTPATIDISKSFSYPTAFQSSTGTSFLPGGQSIQIPSAFIPSQYEDIKVGFYLEFLPSVGRDLKNIVLDIHARVDELSGGLQPHDFTQSSVLNLQADGAASVKRPVIDGREFSTRMVIQDGGTVIIGGLLKNNRDTIHRKVPVLGDIPLLGLLFRYKRERMTQSNLIIVVQADIVAPSGQTFERPEGARRLETPDTGWYIDNDPVLGFGAR